MNLEQNEKALLEGLVQNDSKAIEIIYKQNYKMVQSLVINNNGNYDDANDVFQEAIIALYEKAKSDSFVLTCKINTYLYSVSRRVWLKKLQQRGKFFNNLSENFDIVEVEEDLELEKRKTQEFIIMERALNNMGEPCKSLLEGFYIHKKEMQALAAEFGYTNSDNAKNQKYKCLMRLKKLFFAQYNGSNE